MVDMLAVNACLCPLHLLTSFVSTSCLFAPFTYTCVLHPSSTGALHTCSHPSCLLMPFAPVYTCSCPSGPLEYALHPLMPHHTLSHSSLGLMPLCHHIFIVHDCQHLQPPTDLLITFTTGIILNSLWIYFMPFIPLVPFAPTSVCSCPAHS